MTVPELVDYYTRRMDHSRERVAVMADQLVEFIEAIYDPDERSFKLDIQVDGRVFYIRQGG